MKKNLSGIVLMALGVLFGSSSVYSNEVVDLSHSEFSEKLAENLQTVIIDVRSAAEFSQGRVPNAVNIAHDDILDNPQLLAQYQGQEIIFYCRSGRRVSWVTDYLIKQNFSAGKPLYHLDGDMQAWQAADLPIEK